MNTLDIHSLRQISHPVPRVLPAVIAVTLIGVVLCAALARLENFAGASTTPPPVAKAALTFTDLANGGVSVRNASNGQLIATIPSRHDGFLRMTMRLLAAARMSQHIGQQQPFVLTEFTGGRLLLADPSTRLSIELDAFGPSNAGEFMHFFAPETRS